MVERHEKRVKIYRIEWSVGPKGLQESQMSMDLED